MSIPKHWQVIKLKKLVIPQKGKKPLKLLRNKFPDSISYLDIEAITNGTVTQFADKFSTTLASPEDIFIVADGSRSGLVAQGMTGAVGSTILSLKPVLINPLYLFYFLRSKYYFLNSNTTGISIPHLNKDIFFDLDVIVPPLDEQKIIVEKLEINLKIFNMEFRNLEKELVSVNEYRKSLINQAILGNLFQDEAKNIRKTVSHTIKNVLSFHLPNDWKLLKTEEIFDFVTSGSRNWAKYYNTTEGALFIRIGNLSRNSLKINLSKEKISLVKLPSDIEGTRTKLEKGDILISITGDIGLIGYVEGEIGEAYINQHIALARSKKDFNSKFLAYCLLSDLIKEQLNLKKSGVTRAGLGLDDIYNIYLPSPTIEEQNQIVTTLDEQFQILDSKEFEYNKTLRQKDKLETALLEHAFDGDDFVDKKLVWFAEFEKNLELERERLLESIKITKNKSEKKYRNLKINMNKSRSILQILDEAQNNSLPVEEVWRNSIYYEKANVEGFYEELEKLLSDNTSLHRVSTEFKDQQKMHSFLKLTKNAD